MTDDTTFQPGDVVELKSGGGPKVTVATVDGENFTYYYATSNLIQREDRSTVQAAFKKVMHLERVNHEDVA